MFGSSIAGEEYRQILLRLKPPSNLLPFFVDLLQFRCAFGAMSSESVVLARAAFGIAVGVLYTCMSMETYTYMYMNMYKAHPSSYISQMDI